MDIPRIFNISESAHRIHNPFTPDKFATLGAVGIPTEVLARMVDGGATDFGVEASMLKMRASDLAMRIATDAVQLHGGYGYCKDYRVERLMRDAKITQIWEGTNQIHRQLIGRSFIKK